MVIETFKRMCSKLFPPRSFLLKKMHVRVVEPWLIVSSYI